MKMRSVGMFALLSMVTLNAAAQTPINPAQPKEVSVCDLMSEPAKYNGEVVRVRGQISIAFEDFTLFDKRCPRLSGKDIAVGIWLEFGGDEGAPAIYCCGDHSRAPGKVINVQGHVIPLLRDEQLAEFLKRIRAERQARPDGQQCYDRECYFYDVTATLAGHFFAMQTTKEGGMGGYGHMGFFHLLFIEQVVDLDAQRTQVPAGGVFDCKQEEWIATSAEAEAALAAHQKCKDAKCIEGATNQIRMIGARHFGERFEQMEQWKSGLGGEESETYWSSPDLLSTLDFKFPFKNPYVHTARKNLIITGKSCAALTNPLSPSTKMSCKSGDWDAHASEADARRIQVAVDGGTDLWRLEMGKVAWNAVQNYAREHSIELSSTLEVKDCRQVGQNKVDDALCNLISRDGMQSAWLSLARYNSLKSKRRPKEKIVWILRSGTISYCKAE